MSTFFEPETLEAEQRMLRTDDASFSATRTYIERYILQVLSHFSGDESEKSQALANLLAQIPIAAQRYLENRENPDFKFSTYFGWYISEELKKYTWERIEA